MKPVAAAVFACVFVLLVGPVRAADGPAPFHRAELIFPLEHWHNHGSCIVECPDGDLLVCWFHGSGERSLPLATKPRRPFSRLSTDCWSSPRW